MSKIFSLDSSEFNLLNHEIKQVFYAGIGRIGIRGM